MGRGCIYYDIYIMLKSCLVHPSFCIKTVSYTKINSLKTILSFFSKLTFLRLVPLCLTPPN